MPRIQTLHCRIVLILFLLNGAVLRGMCFNFSYPSFPPNVEGEFERSGRAYIVENALQVTVDIRDSIHNRSGRILYKKPINLWKKGRIASFNSTFVLKITPESNPPGEGLAFILTKDIEVPANSAGQWLGIVNASTNGSSHNSIVAVEFDTKKSFPGDPDNNHVGVNINSINSIKTNSLNNSGLIIANGTNMTAMILYDGVTKMMNISVFQGSLVGAGAPLLSIADLNLTRYLPEKVYAGFSASTGPTSVERNCIREWYFTIDDIVEDSKATGPSKQRKVPWWVWVVVSVCILVLLCGVFGICYWSYKRKPRSSNGNDLLVFSGVGPKKFKLKDLKAATGKFSQKNELGRGGFGIVYKGTLEGQLVAVKRVRDTPKGMENLIAEVTTIGSLHHKNLVELIGWCYEDSELLLVYEYMHNRSLDKLLYCDDTQNTKLSWDKRYNIICGVAQALDYLHNECLKRVLHRDIKASNIMLDSEFNARIGDFGLARMFKLSEKSHHTTKEIAGTPGYMAPELFHTGKATIETDVYAFGVLALVITSGRKPGNQVEQGDYSNNIIDWVWELHSSEMLTNAIDPKLEEHYDARQAETILELGLACCHPNPNMRPSMGHVLQVLIGEAITPSVPLEKPAFVWPAPSPSFTNGDSFSGGLVDTLSTLDGR